MTPDLEEKIKRVRQTCWDQAIHAFGTAYIFEKRAGTLRGRLRWLEFLGIGVPLAVGGIALSFGLQYRHLPSLIVVAGILGIAQLVLSAWSLVAGWQNNLASALESKTANYRLSESYQSLAKNPPDELPEMERRFELLQIEDRLRRDLDHQQTITEKEKRTGMRSALRQFQRPCAGCGKVPRLLKPTNCEVCGNP